MENKCVEEGMKLARFLEHLGLSGASCAQASAEQYEQIAEGAADALSDIDKFSCLSPKEQAVFKKEVEYLKSSANSKNFLYTSDAGHRLLILLHNPQGYVDIYGWDYKPEPVKKELGMGSQLLKVDAQEAIRLGYKPEEFGELHRPFPKSYKDWAKLVSDITAAYHKVTETPKDKALLDLIRGKLAEIKAGEEELSRPEVNTDITRKADEAKRWFVERSREFQVM